MSLLTVFFNLAARILVICVAFPVHESAHAFMAYKLGDQTAKRLGRIDANPLSHLDVLPSVLMLLLASVLDFVTGSSSMGTLILLLTSILFFHPVPINPVYFKNRKAGIALTALAGPLSNILLAYVTLILYKLALYFLPPHGLVQVLCSLLWLVVSINLQLAVFNLLPIAPLDGSKILSFFLSDRINFMIMKYERYILLGFLALLYLTPVFDWIQQIGYTVFYTVIDFLSGFADLLAGVL